MSEENKDLENKAEGAETAKGKLIQEVKKTTGEFKKSIQSVGGENKKVVTAVLAILLGTFGIHKFFLGYNREGIILLSATILLGMISCGILSSITGLIGLIEGIIYLTKSDEEFYKTYQVGRRGWF